MSSSPTSTFTFTLTTLAAVGIIVACSPNNGKAPIGVRDATPFQKAVSACADSMSSSQKVKPPAGTRTVEICEFPLKVDGTIDSKTVRTVTEVSFSVQKADGKERAAGNVVNLAVVLGFVPSAAIEEKEENDFKGAFEADCVADTKKIFERSNFGEAVKLNLTLALQFDGDAMSMGDLYSTQSTSLEDSNNAADGTPKKVVADHELRIEKQMDDKDAYWIFNQIPSLPRYYPHGKLADSQACVAAGGSPLVQVDCKRAHRKLLNLPACAALAKRVGNVLGIVDAAKENAMCGAIQPATTVTDAAILAPNPIPATVMSEFANGKPSPPTSPDSSFAKPTKSDDDFMKSSELNKKDLITILSPACPSLKNLK